MLQSRSSKELHHFGGAGAVTQCSFGSKYDVQHRQFSKNDTNQVILLLFLCIFTLIFVTQNMKKTDCQA
jgi:hypothetical protein